MISIIVATDLNGGIGYNNSLLFHLSEDLKRFKKITTGYTIIMGRNTKESLPKGYLPNRDNIILSSTMKPEIDYVENDNAWIVITNSLKQIIRNYYESKDEVFVVGGASIYEQLLPYVNKIYLTKILAEAPDVDTYFPKINYDEFRVEYESSIKIDFTNDVKYQFVDLVRK